MRARIIARLHPGLELQSLYETNKAKYDQIVINLFRTIGFNPRAVGEAIETHPALESILKDIPKDDPLLEEFKHKILIGYISAGQAHFLVCSVNALELHIRAHASVFDRLAQSCEQLYEKSTHGYRREFTRKFPWIRTTTPHLNLGDRIEVMEPGRDFPTIWGHHIRKAVPYVLAESPYERLVLVVTGVASGALFWFTPTLARHVTKLLGSRFEEAYIQGAMERTYSAFLVTFFITLLSLLFRIFDVNRRKPIYWDPSLHGRKKLGNNRKP